MKWERTFLENLSWPAVSPRWCAGGLQWQSIELLRWVGFVESGGRVEMLQWVGVVGTVGRAELLWWVGNADAVRRTDRVTCCDGEWKKDPKKISLKLKIIKGFQV
jgi:hypothetical protein